MRNEGRICKTGPPNGRPVSRTYSLKLNVTILPCVTNLLYVRLSVAKVAKRKSMAFNNNSTTVMAMLGDFGQAFPKISPTVGGRA